MSSLDDYLFELTLGLQSDGADLDVVEKKENKLVLRYTGKSNGFTALKQEPKEFLSQQLKTAFPELKTIDFVD